MPSKSNITLSRRRFIQSSSVGLLGAGITHARKSYCNGFDEENSSHRIRKYNTLGRTGFKVSDIGCGTQVTNNAEVIRAAIDSGINYIDTAAMYVSESLVGDSIEDINRKSLFITTKVSPMRGFQTKEQIIGVARKSLEALKTDYVDCLMIHSAQSKEILKSDTFHAAVNQLKSEGHLRFCGVSCHGTIWAGNPKESMEEILLSAVDDGRFDVLLMTYNFLMQDSGKNIMKACKEKNIGTTIMKTDPYNRYFELQEFVERNTQAGNSTPEWVKNLIPKFDQYKEQAGSFIEKHDLTSRDEIKAAAIRFALDNPDADCVLVSFDNFEDIEKIVKVSGNPLSSSEKKTLKDYEKTFGTFYCRHACDVCEKNCPYHVPVNTIMRYEQYYHAQKREKYAMDKYNALKGSKADQCEKCEGFCESSCPYNVPIQGLLNMAHNTLT